MSSNSFLGLFWRENTRGPYGVIRTSPQPIRKLHLGYRSGITDSKKNKNFLDKSAGRLYSLSRRRSYSEDSLRVGAKRASVRKTTGRSACARIAVGKYTMLKLNEVKISKYFEKWRFI